MMKQKQQDPHVRRIAPKPDYRTYELLKARIDINLTPAQYEAECRRIAALCGL